MEWTGIKNIKTINTNLNKLKDSGLLIVKPIKGEQSGSIYEVLLPKELNPYQTHTRDTPDPNRS